MTLCSASAKPGLLQEARHTHSERAPALQDLEILAGLLQGRVRVKEQERVGQTSSLWSLGGLGEGEMPKGMTTDIQLG